MTQNHFRLKLGPDSRKNLPQREIIAQERDFNGKTNCQKVAPAKLFADLLKGRVRRIVQDVTECQPDTLPAHLARLDDWRAVVEHLIRHDFRETPESRRSDKQLIYASTLVDWLAIAETTRQQHRAPAFANACDTELSQINHKLDLLGGLMSGLLNVQTPEAFTNLDGESERV